MKLVRKLTKNPSFLMKSNLWPRGISRQLSLFVVVGGVCYLFSIGLLILFVEVFGVEVNLANLVISLIAIYLAYILNRKYIFNRGRYSLFAEVSAFYFFSLIGLIINVVLMYLMTVYVPISYIIIKTTITIVVAAFNFLSRKYWVFNG